MRLLVSVRSVEEARAAVRGGADIIDAKEPGAGVLAPVSLPVLHAIEQAIPPHMPLSVALGDIASTREVIAAIEALSIAMRPAEVFAKFAPVSSSSSAPALVRAAVVAAHRHPCRPGIVVAAYVDRYHQRWLDLCELVRASAHTGAQGFLLDTSVKDGRSLFDWCTMDELAQFTALARSLGTIVALAGSLAVRHVPIAARSGAEILGVRGAVCSGGRSDGLDEARVLVLAHQVRQVTLLHSLGRHAADIKAHGSRR